MFFDSMIGMPFGMFDPWDHGGGNSYHDRAEKSRSAQSRQDQAEHKFGVLKEKLETTLFDKVKMTIALGCSHDSDSPLKLLPAVSINQIFEFLPKPPKTIPPLASAATASDEVDLMDISLYKPGNKIVIPLTKPNLHLTAPCWRDFSRAVRRNEGWDVKRTTATAQEKKKYKETRQGKVYFIDAIYTVPGKQKKKRAIPKKNSDVEAPAKKKVKKTAPKATVGDSNPPAKKKATKTRSADAKIPAKKKAAKNKKA